MGHHLGLTVSQQVLPADVGLGGEVLEFGPVHGLGALPDMGADVTVQLHAQQLQLTLKRRRRRRDISQAYSGGHARRRTKSERECYL